jgi:C-terminal peptidase prc
MSRICRGVVCAFLALLCASPARAADVKFERTRMKTILRVVVSDIEKNFYDASMKGLDWKAEVQAAEARIDKAELASDMVTAIFVLVNKLNDSHTLFLPPGRVNKPMFGFNAKAFGDVVMIYEVVKKGAAEKAGLRPGDRIVTVNGFTVERKSFGMMMLYYHLLRPVDVLKIQYVRGGEPPQTIDLQATMKEGTAILDLTDEINIWNMIRESMSDEKPFHYQTYDGVIGYLHLPDFEADPSFQNNLVGKVKDSKAIIVDLRGNPGGVVDYLEFFAGGFVRTPEVIAQVKGRKKDEVVKTTSRATNVITGPMYVLVDSESASAAEMFARHFQRTGHAVVIGDKTSGRVNVARFYAEQLGVDTVVPYGVVVSTGQVTFPDGQILEATGVTPDKMCLPTSADLAADKDPCLDLARSLAREKLGLKPPAAAEEEEKK